MRRTVRHLFYVFQFHVTGRETSCLLKTRTLHAINFKELFDSGEKAQADKYEETFQAWLSLLVMTHRLVGHSPRVARLWAVEL